MNITPYEASSHYFEMFHDISNGNLTEKALGILKVISVATLIIPITFYIIYLVSKPIQTRSITHTPILPSREPKLKPFREVLEQFEQLSELLKNGFNPRTSIDPFQATSQIKDILARLQVASYEEIEGIDPSKLEILGQKFQLFIEHPPLRSQTNCVKVYNGMIEIHRFLENANAFVIALSSIPSPNYIKSHFSLFLPFFAKDSRYKKLIPIFLSLNPRELELSITSLQNYDLFILKDFTLPFVLEGPEDQDKIDTFENLMKIRASIKEIKRLHQIIQMLDRKIEPEPDETIPVLGIASSNPTMVAKFSRDQSRYQREFMEIVKIGSLLIREGKNFSDCLAHFASKRREMEFLSGISQETSNRFGKSRDNRALFTKFGNSYHRYLAHFLQSEKQGWDKKWKPSAVTYTMTVSLERSQDPLVLTTIYLDPQTASWEHTPAKNISAALKKAEALFDIVVSLPSPNAGESLEPLLEVIGEFHWWMAHACPFMRGSSAITKMMVAAILKSKGVEPGGFGHTEPDCMALIKNLDEFKREYSRLMQFPPAHIAPKESLE